MQPQPPWSAKARDPADDYAEQLVLALRGAGFEVVATVEHSTRGRLATVRLAPPDPAGALVDLLFASSGVEAEVVRGADALARNPALRKTAATNRCLRPS